MQHHSTRALVSTILACRAGDRAWPSGDVGIGITALSIDMFCFAVLPFFFLSPRQPLVGRAERPMDQRPPGHASTGHPHATTMVLRTWMASTTALLRAQSIRHIGTICSLPTGDQLQSAVSPPLGFHGIDTIAATLPI